jgi:hypothetical protein
MAVDGSTQRHRSRSILSKGQAASCECNIGGEI